MKIVTVIGARPQFIKAAAFSREIADTSNIQEIIVHTGQHFDPNMSEVFFEELCIPKPKYNLGISGGTHADMTAKMMIGIEKILLDEKPDALLVYGDTNSTMAAALAAVKIYIPVIHVEAGVRMGTMTNPEEVNRIVTDHVSTLLFTPTQDEVEQLAKEDIRANVFAVGNIMYDSYLYAASKDIDLFERPFFNILEEKDQVIPDKYYYMTCHRQENTFSDEPLNEIFKAMNVLDYQTVYPVHPRNRDRAIRLCKEHRYKNIILINPVGYFESVALLKHCEKVVTDSGGLQCEAFYAQKQCVTIFDHVVWKQTMVDKRNQLAKACKEDILLKLETKQIINPDYKPFGDGDTSSKIKEKIVEVFG